MKRKVAVITGGAHGIGRAMVEGFEKNNIQVAFIDKDKEAGEEVAKKVFNDDTKGFFYHGDLAIKEDMEQFIIKVMETFEQVDYLINNACIHHYGIFSGCSYEDFNEVLKVGVTAPYYLTLLLENHFTRGGSIVNISSTRENMSQEDTESYSAAKGGIGSLTHALAMSLAGRVRVNSISPGWIDTREGEEALILLDVRDLDQHPVKRIGRTEDVVHAALFLCDEKSGFINGEDIVIDGGMSRKMIYHGGEGWTYHKGKGDI